MRENGSKNLRPAFRKKTSTDPDNPNLYHRPLQGSDCTLSQKKGLGSEKKKREVDLTKKEKGHKTNYLILKRGNPKGRLYLLKTTEYGRGTGRDRRGLDVNPTEKLAGKRKYNLSLHQDI